MSSTLTRWDTPPQAVSLLSSAWAVPRGDQVRDNNLTPSSRCPGGPQALVAAGVRADNEITWSLRMTRVVASKNVFLK